ncbi:large conductance mechanosensitive channel protein MscL [Leptothermofonsia sichuanensis E412]|uniref:large conductance mechanosensitive channel protein MscL n=1 Tax=Leptothermofonsia sichuanensis TaxID=2917832 RepID=UPI001CA6F000|nr:large conductance mechanosensitive channel protein MscL [Leptothermofonsia sichuanensis]QZZ18844.1 large conductance mechanosensitive channel protein MscL [Leptothermofonsia sichuanensis E412]
MTRSNGGFWADFRKFISQGNVVDLAVAVVIGGAFGKIVESFVGDIITPAILNPALQAANVKDLNGLVVPGTAIKYGSFLATIINFLVIAFSIFLVIRAYEKARKRFERQQAAEEAAAPDPVALQQQTADALNRLAQAMENRGI